MPLWDSTADDGAPRSIFGRLVDPLDDVRPGTAWLGDDHEDVRLRRLQRIRIEPDDSEREESRQPMVVMVCRRCGREAQGCVCPVEKLESPRGEQATDDVHRAETFDFNDMDD